MADSSFQPPRQADLDALTARLAQLQAKYRPVLDQLNASAAQLNAQLDRAGVKTQEQAAAAERVGQVRQARAPLAASEASSIERLAAAETRAAAAAERRAIAERQSATAAQTSAAAVAAAGSGAQKQLPAGARFYGGGPRDVGITDILGGNRYAQALQQQAAMLEDFQRRQAAVLGRFAPPPQLQLPPASQIQVGPAGPLRTDFNSRGGIGPLPADQAKAAKDYADELKRQGDAERARAGATAQSTAATVKADAANRDYVSSVLASKTAVGDIGADFERNAQRLGLASQSLTRHGYLTSEAISEFGRGRLTIRELGTQVVGTTAKFAGWTAAATAVYGAVAAFGQLGRGAIESESGVNQLNRVVTKDLAGGMDEVRQRFRDLSQEFNLPLDQVTEAAFGMAKAFKGDLPQALEATRASLLAIKVGEIEAADATRYLTAIINGFGLDASQLNDTFDALNQLQNRFGGNISQTAAGVAKAAGSFKAAGGDYLTLTKLVTAGVKTTGGTGENVGTAFLRSAGRVLTDEGKKAVEDIGLDPELNYPELFAQAIEKSRGASGATINRIARALVPSGGHFARILIPILQNPDLLAVIDKELAQRANSGKKELDKLRESPQEKLKAIPVAVGNLGSALGQANALAPLLAFVAALKEGLELVTSIVEVLERLPGPIGEAIIPAAELFALFKGAQAVGLFRSPDREYSNSVGRGAEAVREEQSRIYQGSLRTADTNLSRANASGIRAAQLEREIAATSDLQKQASIAKNLDKTYAQQTRYLAAANVASIEAGFAQQELAALETRLAETKRLQVAGLSAQQAAAQSGLVYRSPKDGGVAGQPIPIGTRGVSPSLYVREPGADRGTQQLRLFATQQEAVTREQTKFAQVMQRGGIVTGALAGAASRGVSAAGKLAGGIKSAAGKMTGFLRALGPLDIALLAFIGVQEGLSQLKEHEERLDEARKPRNIFRPEDLRAKADSLRSEPGFFGKATNFLGDITVRAPQTFDPFGESPDQKRQKERLPDLLQAAEFEKVAAKLQELRSDDKLLLVSEIEDRLEDGLKAATSTAERVAAFDEAIKLAEQDRVAGIEAALGRDFRPSRDDQAIQKAFLSRLRSQRQAAAIRDASLTPAQQVEGLDQAKLGDYITATSARVQLQGTTPVNADRLRAQFGRLREMAEGGENIENVVKLAGQLNQQANQVIESYVAANPQSTPEGQARVRAQGVARARRAFNLRGLRQQAATLKRQIEAFTEGANRASREASKLADDVQAESQARRQGDVEPGPVRQKFQRLLNRARDGRDKARKANRALRILEQLLSLVFGTIAQAANVADHARFEAAQALHEANTALQAAQAGGGLAGERIVAQRGAGRLGAIAKEYGKNSVEFITAQTDLITTQNSVAEQQRAAAEDQAQKAQAAAEEARAAQAALISAQANYAASLTTNPVAIARIRLREAQRLRGLASTQAERLDAGAEVNNRRRELRDSKIQSKLDDIQFNASIGRLSREAEIAQLEALKKRVRGNKQLRRDIIKQIYDLKNDANGDQFDLNVGDIKLPTIYDIRRLAKQGTQSGPRSVQQTNQFNVTITDPASAEAFWAEGERTLGGSFSAMRSAGVT